MHQQLNIQKTATATARVHNVYWYATKAKKHFPGHNHHGMKYLPTDYPQCYTTACTREKQLLIIRYQQ